MASPPKLTLWGVGTSRTIRAHWAMAELGLAYARSTRGPVRRRPRNSPRSIHDKRFGCFKTTISALVKAQPSSLISRGLIRKGEHRLSPTATSPIFTVRAVTLFSSRPERQLQVAPATDLRPSEIGIGQSPEGRAGNSIVRD